MFGFRRLFSIPSLNLTINASCRIKYDKRNFAKIQVRQPQKQLQQLVMADSHYIQRQKYGILEIYPNVKTSLKNMYSNLNNNLSSSFKCHQNTAAVGRIKNNIVYHCNFSVTWPSKLSFTGYGFKKRDAELAAMIKTIEYLYTENFITLNGHPVTVSEEEKTKLIKEWSRPPTISLSTPVIENGWNLIREFNKEIKPFIDKHYEKTSFLISNAQEESDDENFLEKAHGEEEIEDDSISDLEEDQVLNLLTGRKNVVDQAAKEIRSRNLYHKCYERLSYITSDHKKPLPISQYKDQLEKALDEKQIVIVAGDTGCGKSTQVPQIILDKWCLEGKGADCNILISQPRRISAIALAKYVAKDRKEQLGESVGYHVRMGFKRLQDTGGIMFLTTGMLLQGLHSNSSLEGVSHVIIDEVHERSVPTDLLLILLHRLTHSNPNLKLILMSASISTKELENYFGKNKCSLIEVPGALYPLNRYYLPGALKELSLSPYSYQLEQLTEPGSHPFVNVGLVVDVIKAIEITKPPGAILCFLPGWQDINNIQMRLQEEHSVRNRLLVLPLHSRLNTSDQEKIFEKPPSGLRKVVLATNIAETSLTVEDVVYVIDCGCHKEQRYDNRKKLSVLGNHWISKANSQQRAGRAGRVQPGEVFHLYSKDIHNNMNAFPVPEIMRIPLEHVILQCKGHCDKESVHHFLSAGLSVPSNKLMNAATKNLEQLGMLKINPYMKDESLTPLGRRVVHFSTPPYLSKAIVYSSIFRCVESVLAISSALSSGRGIFLNSIEKRAEIRKTKADVNATSDLLAILSLIHEWEEIDNYRDSVYYCNEHNLSHRGLRYNNGIKKVYADHLRDGFLIDRDNISSYGSKWNLNNVNTQLVLGVLLAGVNRILLLQRGILSKGILRKNERVIKTIEGSTINTGSDCVLHNIPENIDNSSRHLLCVQLTRDDTSRRTVARDLSLLQPLTVSLFAGNNIILKPFDEGYILTIDGNEELAFIVDKRIGEFLQELRTTINEMINIIIETRGLDISVPSDFDFICGRLVDYVSNLLDVSDHKYHQRRRRSILNDDGDW